MAVVRIEDPKVPSPSAGGFALFELGFRPFFLGAGLMALLVQALWLAVLMGWVASPDYYGEIGWHAHEMLYGYSAAVIAGFLLTAGSNWVGKPMLKGRPLMWLVVLWCAGRLLPLFPFVAHWMIALVDFLFLPVVAVVMLRPVIKVKQWRNIAFPVFVLMMAIGNAMVHAEALGLADGSAMPGWMLGLYVILLIIALMGGRVIPFFIERGAEGARVRKWKGVEVVSLASIAVLMISETVAFGSTFSFWAALVAALANAVRWVGWLSRPAFKVPLLWVLIAGYGWLVVGLLMLPLSMVSDMSVSLPIHAFTVGAIGVLTLGMMARVSLGHTGRVLKAHPLMSWSFALINLAVAVRVGLPLVWAAEIAVGGATLLWLAAFLIFVVIYAPILIRPRVDNRPG